MFEINTCLCVIVKGLYCISKNSTEKSIMLNPELQPDQNMAPMLFVASLVMYIFIIKLHWLQLIKKNTKNIQNILFKVFFSFYSFFGKIFHFSSWWIVIYNLPLLYLVVGSVNIPLKKKGHEIWWNDQLLLSWFFILDAVIYYQTEGKGGSKGGKETLMWERNTSRLPLTHP